MAKKKRSSRIKKTKGQTDPKLHCCYSCSQPFDFVANSFIQCCCSGVRYCSKQCQDLRPHEGCPGQQKLSFDVENLMKKLTLKSRTENDDGEAALATNLYSVISDPQYLSHLRSISLHPRDLTADTAAKIGCEGKSPLHQAFLCLAGLRYTFGMIGPYKVEDGGRIICDNSKHRVSSLHAKRLGFKYLHSSAELGYTRAMQSIAECYLIGSGCRANLRYSNQWMWRSSLKCARDAVKTISKRALITNEMKSTSTTLIGDLNRSPDQGIFLAGIGLTGLLLAFRDIIHREEYSLPPFAGIFPKALGAPFCGEKISRIPLVGADDMKILLRICGMLSSKGHDLQVAYGRRGTMNAVQTRFNDNAPRWIDSPRYLVPPPPGCDETVTDTEVKLWTSSMEASNRQIRIACGHKTQEALKSPSADNNPFAALYAKNRLPCLKCIAEARDRLWAVSCGKVVLSENEPRRGHGNSAIYQSKDNGRLCMETWMAYSSSDVECVLAVLAASGEQVFQNPLFIAQDPNFVLALGV